MSKSSTKQLAKRRMARIHNHLDTAIDLLATEYSLFIDYHPDKAEQLAFWAQGLFLILEQMEQFWEECWGPLPEDMSSWT